VNQVVDFEVTDRNYWVAVASLISRKIALKIRQDRVFHEIAMSPEEKQEYHSQVERKFGGTASTSNFSKAVKICYSVIERGITEITLSLVNKEKPIFVVAKDVASQQRLAQSFEQSLHLGHPLRVCVISSRHSICLTPNDAKIYDVIITTCTHSTGFTLTQADTMVTAIYFSNQATRDQLDGRILRVGQVSEQVTVHILHTGILSYTKNHYEDARSLRISMQDLSESVSFESVPSDAY
jgi:late competence protein required for DNA uptake (superfamily II DNA/RNA helicase)